MEKEKEKEPKLEAYESRSWQQRGGEREQSRLKSQRSSEGSACYCKLVSKKVVVVRERESWVDQSLYIYLLMMMNHAFWSLEYYGGKKLKKEEEER